MKFNEILDKILEKTDISFKQTIRKKATTVLKPKLLKCIGYTGVIPKEFLNDPIPESKIKWIALKLFKNIAFYFDKEIKIDDLIEIFTILQHGRKFISESQLLNFFKIEPIYKKNETYLSLYHHLFIFLAFNQFIEATILFFKNQKDRIVERTLTYNKGNKIFLDLIFYLITVDGKIHRHERKIFNELTSMLNKNIKPQKRIDIVTILKIIDHSGFDKEVLETIYKIALVTTMIDNKETKEEKLALDLISETFNFTEKDHNRLLLEVTNYLYQNQEIIYRSPFHKIFNAFEKTVIKRVTNIVTSNKDKIMKELTETKEMAQLINKRRKGQMLTTKEAQMLNSQLVDIFKTIPALGIFLLPGGTVLLPVLSKILPFNILPSSFAAVTENEVEEVDTDLEDFEEDACQ